MKSFFKYLIPYIQGEFHIDLEKYPKANSSSLTKSIETFVKRQYPSKSWKEHDRIEFKNGPIRLKVSRGQNFIRSFSSGFISISKQNGALHLNYSGRLLRGVFITALFGVLAIVFCAAYWSQLYWLPSIVILLSYFFQIVLTHIVFPLALKKAVTDYLKTAVK